MNMIMIASFMKHRAASPFLFLVAMSVLLPSADGQTLGAALNSPNLTWTTSGTGPSGDGWSADYAVSLDGLAVESGSIPYPSSSSILQTAVTGPGILSFWWYPPVPDGGAAVTFSVNGVTAASTTNSLFPSWEQQTVYIGAGAQTLEWVFAVTPSSVWYGDYSFLDEVTFTPGTNAPVITDQPSSQSQVRGLTNTFTIGVAGAPPLSYQWQFNSTNISGATSPSYTVTNVQAANLGAYSVTVTNLAGLSNSVAASLEFGEVTAWGLSNVRQTQIPPGATRILAIAGALRHSLALRADGTILFWGSNLNGQGNIPPDLTNVVAVGAGLANSLALKADGTVTEWGDDSYNQDTPPASLTNAVAIAISKSGSHSLALRSDGTVTAWGRNSGDQTNVPNSLSNVVAVGAGESHSVALKSDGTVVAWGVNYEGVTSVPPGLSNVVTISVGAYYSLALKSDGTVVWWGVNISPPASATNLVAIAAGDSQSLGLRPDGTVIAWGSSDFGATNVPAGLSNVVEIAAGSYHSLARVGNGTPIVNPQIGHPILSAQGLSLSVPSESGRVYRLEYTGSLSNPSWSALPLVAGNGTNLVLTDPAVSGSARFYRVRRW